MRGYILKRLLFAIPAVLGVMIVAFIFMNISGDPTYMLVQPGASPEQIAAVRHDWGLDAPLYVRFVDFFINAMQGDFGVSFKYNAPALQVVLARFPATIQLSIVSTIISVIIGVPLGVIAALKRGSIIDNVVMFTAVLGQSVAQFWLGIILMLVFTLMLGWLPTSGYSGGIIPGKTVILPALTLAPWLMTLMARLTRSGMLDVLSRDYIRTAHAKGLSSIVILFKHALRNALLPVVTMFGIAVAWQTGGSVIVESVFAWPGIGLLMYNSVVARDYAPAVCIVTLVAIAFVIINLLVDIIVVRLDPRIRLNR